MGYGGTVAHGITVYCSTRGTGVLWYTGCRCTVVTGHAMRTDPELCAHGHTMRNSASSLRRLRRPAVRLGSLARLGSLLIFRVAAGRLRHRRRRFLWQRELGALVRHGGQCGGLQPCARCRAGVGIACTARRGRNRCASRTAAAAAYAHPQPSASGSATIRSKRHRLLQACERHRYATNRGGAVGGAELALWQRHLCCRRRRCRRRTGRCECRHLPLVPADHVSKAKLLNPCAAAARRAGARVRTSGPRLALRVVLHTHVLSRRAQSGRCAAASLLVAAAGAGPGPTAATPLSGTRCAVRRRVRLQALGHALAQLRALTCEALAQLPVLPQKLLGIRIADAANTGANADAGAAAEGALKAVAVAIDAATAAAGTAASNCPPAGACRAAHGGRCLRRRHAARTQLRLQSAVVTQRLSEVRHHRLRPSAAQCIV
eukprot:365057-Chlamydomonas_euryale.AAC.25